MFENEGTGVKEEIIRKYVEDLDGLLEEVAEMDTYKEEHWEENMLIFIFGRLFRFFSFSDIHISHDTKGDLDATGYLESDESVEIEFEVFSESFRKDHLNHIKKDEKVLVVCWEDNWENPPDNIDIIELKHFWEMKANK
jgi:hypothetical protein